MLERGSDCWQMGSGVKWALEGLAPVLTRRLGRDWCRMLRSVGRVWQRASWLRVEVQGHSRNNFSHWALG